MKINLSNIIFTLVFILFSFSLFSQNRKIPFSLGIHLISDFRDNSSSLDNIGSDLGFSCNIFLIEKITFSSSFSYGYKQYDIRVSPLNPGGTGPTRKVFDEKSISFEADFKYNLQLYITEFVQAKYPLFPRIVPYLGLGFIFKSPMKINGISELELSPAPLDLEWNLFEINKENLSPNYGLKILAGIDLKYLENYFMLFELGRIYYPENGFKDLLENRSQRVLGLDKNENYSYFKFGVGYIFN